MSRTCFPTSSLVAASSPNTSKSFFKPGGTMMLTVGPTASRVMAKQTDEMGRWVATTYTRKHNPPITIITIYQPIIQQYSRKFTNTNQQRALLDIAALREGQARTSPREAFQKDLKELVASLAAQQHAIIVGGDFNAIFGIESNLLERMARENELIDVMAHKHGHHAIPATHIKGKTRIDFILISRSLLPAIDRCGYEAFDATFHSDHRGMFIDFNTQALFHTKPVTLAPPAVRDFNTRRQSTLQKYITTKHQQMENHNVFDRLQNLQLQNPIDPTVLEAIDRDMVRASLTAGKRCRSKHKSPWSPKVTEAWAKATFYRIAMSSHKNKIDNSKALSDLKSKAYEDLQFPVTLAEAKEHYI